MTTRETTIAGVTLLTPPRFDDERGAFRPIFAERLHPSLGLPKTWSEMSVSHSAQNCIRGLHFQAPKAQAKLITVIEGSIFDVALDLRKDSPTFGKYQTFELAANSDRLPSQIYLPEGIAHGIATPTEPATIAYLVSTSWHPESEHVIAWDDADLAIPWPVDRPHLSTRDSQGLSWSRFLKTNL